MLKLRLKQYPSLLLIVLLATLLRFWRLAAKPLWVDELYTTFYSLGKNLGKVPTGILFPPERYWALFLGSSAGSPNEAAQAVTTYSNHPPLFFVAMNRWLYTVGTSVWSLRAFAAIWGVIAVVGIFYLGRRLGSARVGYLAALLMAVSPYGIYLSQEARHYSIAIAISIFALINWIALLEGERSPQRWLCWVGLNALGMYIHYFYSFSIIAQWLVTISRILWRHERRPETLPWLLAMGGTIVLYIPWLSKALSHFLSEGGTNWLSQSTPLWQMLILPWLQSLVAGVFMLILLPVEQVPFGVTLLSAVVMLIVFGIVLNQVIKGWRVESLLDPWSSPIVSYGLTVFGVMMAITYGLGKDLTLAPRYFFMLYPAVTVAAAQALAQRKRWVVGVAIAAGILSQVLISYDVALLKPYLPGQVGRRLSADAQPTVVLLAPQRDNYRARTLSYVLAISQNTNTQVAFTESANTKIWQPKLRNSNNIPAGDFTLWLVEPRRQEPFPLVVNLSKRVCSPVGNRIKTEGTRQQQYRCGSVDL